MNGGYQIAGEIEKDIHQSHKNFPQAAAPVIKSFVDLSRKIGFLKAFTLFGWIGSWIVWVMYYALMNSRTMGKGEGYLCSGSHHPWLSWTSFMNVLYQKDPCNPILYLSEGTGYEHSVWWPDMIPTAALLFPLFWYLLSYSKTRKDWLIQELTGETPEDKNATPESGNIVRGRFSQKSGKKISRASFMRKFVFFYSLFTFLPVAIGIQMIHDHLYFASGWFWYGMFFLFCAFCSLVLGPVFSPWPDLSQYKTEQETTQDVGRYIRN